MENTGKEIQELELTDNSLRTQTEPKRVDTSLESPDPKAILPSLAVRGASAPDGLPAIHVQRRPKPVASEIFGTRPRLQIWHLSVASRRSREALKVRKVTSATRRRD